MIGKAIFNKCLPVGHHHRSLVILLFNLTTGSYPEIALIPNCYVPGSCPFLYGNPGGLPSGCRLFRPHPYSYFYLEQIFFYLFLFSCRQLSLWEVETMVWIGILWLQCIELAFANQINDSRQWVRGKWKSFGCSFLVLAPGKEKPSFLLSYTPPPLLPHLSLLSRHLINGSWGFVRPWLCASG